MSNANRKSAKQKRVIPTQISGVAINKAETHPADLLVEQALLNGLNDTIRDISPPSPPSPPSVTDQITDEESFLTFPIAPEKNFQKVSNTITKDAIPSGLFRQGKTKQLYDVLYSLTRGAIKPKRIIQISKPKLRSLAGIGAKTTMNTCLESLIEVGLVKVTISEGGTYDGNIYEVLLPEEVISASPPSPPSPPDPGQKVGSLGGLTSSPPSPGSTSINIEGKTVPKTLFKTNQDKIDDERYAPFTIFLEILNEVFKELTGKGIDHTDADAFREIATILANELRQARAKTKSISKPSAFLAQHLKNRLSAPTAPMREAKTTKIKSDTVGKPNEELHDNLVNLSDYTPEELAELEKNFCLQCGKAHDECTCSVTKETHLKE